MKVGDRVMYRNEPYHVVGFLNTRDRGWVLVEHADGSRRFVRPKELHLIQEAEQR